MSHAQRPSRRRFDRDAALATAMELFWRHGYEATSMADLLQATGLTAPSLYAAFGNKERLFLAAVEHYAATYAAVLYRPLEEPVAAREAIERMLREAAAIFSVPGHPAGCFLVSAAVNCSPGSARIADELRRRRAEKERVIRDRLARAVETGELSAAANPARLAKFFNAVMQGLNTQARDGATREELEAVVEQAMAAWPADPPAP